MSRNKHRPEMIAAWAKENGIRGFEMYDPQYRDSLKRKRYIVIENEDLHWKLDWRYRR